MSLRKIFRKFGAKAAGKRPVERSVRLDGRRIYILPTGNGVFFAFIVGAILIGSLNYQSSLGFIFTFMLASLGLVSMVETQRNLTALVLEVSEAKPVFAGEDIYLPLAVSAPGGRLRRGLGAVAEGGERAVFSTGAQPHDLLLKLPAKQRGVWEAGRVTLDTSFPLGLFRAWSPVHFTARVVVYPAPHPRPGPLPTIGTTTGGEGLQGGGRTDAVEDFHGLRGYVETDPPSRVHWKSAARTGTLTVKEFEASSLPSRVSLSYAALADPDPEARLSVLCAWALAAAREGLAWTLSLPGTELEAGSGPAHLRRTLDALAEFRP